MAVLVAAVCVVGGITLATRSPSSPAPGAPGASSSPPAASASSAPATATALPSTVAPAVLPTAAPSDVTWQLVGQAAVPVSRSAGPTVIGTTASGYAHTPVGALIAAAQLTARAGYSAGRAVWEPTITGQYLPGADRDRLLAALRAYRGEPAAPGELAQIAGYQYQIYTPDVAAIGLVYRSPGSAADYQILAVTLRWVGGDWRMSAPPGGTWVTVARRTTDLTGIVKWGAQ